MNKRNILLCVLISLFTISIYANSPLKYVEITGKINRSFYAFVPLTIIKDFSFTEHPAYISSNPIYLNYAISKKDSIKMVFDEQSGDGKGYDTLYVDLNRDGKITENEKIKTSLERSIMQNFSGSVMSDIIKTTIEPTEGIKISFSFYVVFSVPKYGLPAGNNFLAVNGMWYEGDIDSNGKKLKSAVTFDLFKYIGSKNILSSIKYIFIDIDGDGFFRGGEIFPYNKDTEITLEHNYYFPVFDKISDDYQNMDFELKKLDLKYGILHMPQYKDFMVRVYYSLDRGRRRVWDNKGENYKCSAPEGKGLNPAYTISKKDDAGNVWQIQVADRGELKIEEGKTIEISIEPVTAKVTAFKRGSSISLNLVYNIANEKLAGITVFKNGVKIPAPKLSVLDDKGEVVYQAQFKYG